MNHSEDDFIKRTEDDFIKRTKDIQIKLALAINSQSRLFDIVKILCGFIIEEFEEIDCAGLFLADSDQNFKLFYHQGCTKKFIQHVSYFEKDHPNLKNIEIIKKIYKNYEDLDFIPYYQEEGILSSSIHPIYQNKRIIAILTTASHLQKSYSFFSKYNLDIICSFVGDSIARTLYKKQINKTNKSLTFQNEILKKIGTTTDILDLIIYVSEKFKDYTNSCSVGVRIIHPDGNIPYQINDGFPSNYVISDDYFVHKMRDCICANLINKNYESIKSYLSPNGSFLCNNVQQEKENLNFGFQKKDVPCFLYNYEAVLIIPLKSEDQDVGFIHLVKNDATGFAIDDVFLLENLSLHAGKAILKMMVEEELEKNEEKFRIITENSSVGVIIIQNKIIKYLNNSVEELLEINKNDLVGDSIKKLNIIFPKEILEGNMINPAAIEKTDEKKYQKTIKIHQFRTKEIKWVDISSKSIFYADGPAIIFTINDVTKLVESRMFFEESEKLIRELHEREIENLRVIDQIKTDFIYRASHELKTPLNAINSSIRLLSSISQSKFNPKEKELVELIQYGGIRLQKLINSLVESFRVEDDSLELNKTHEDLIPIIKDTIDFYTVLINKRNHTIEFKSPEKIYAKVDKIKFQQVLTNLIVNAINYTPPGGKITIEIADKEQFLEVKVKDTGIGIKSENIPQLFQRFGKIEHYGLGKDVITEGSGLGLYISRQIMEMHNGKINVSSEGEGKGSCFTLGIPKIISTEDHIDHL